MSSNNSNKLTPRARYRALAMIKLGEWWDSREAAFRLAVRTVLRIWKSFSTMT